MHQAKGFTLIELMVVAALISIMTAYAITTYSKYAGEQRMSRAKSAMQNLQVSLQDYKLRNLTYKGFATATQTVYLPDSTKVIYTIKVVDAKDGEAMSATSYGRDWSIIATPSNTTDKWLMVNSYGERCMGATSITASSTTCPTGSETW